jgi:glutaconyl-CoA/methylmalonyl-CoA decarboxylase subunit gamma
MNYTVKIADQTYEVEIEDIHARPIIARVDGQSFEVHPENGIQPEHSRSDPKEFKIHETPKAASDSIGNMNELTAPLPGTIVEIFVRNGEEIETGNIVLIIEAMKMKNSIRSTRGGKVTEVLVRVGETVAHKQALVRFE